MDLLHDGQTAHSPAMRTRTSLAAESAPPSEGIPSAWPGLQCEAVQVTSLVSDWHQICRSQKIRRLLEKASRYASAAGPVLILGECGTGTMQLAHYIHAAGAGRSLPLLRVSCGKLAADVRPDCGNRPPTSFSRTLSVDRDRPTTWLLEGVGEIPELLQPGFSEFVDQILVKQEPATHPRLLATANHDLINAMEEGRFRHDLFYRLNVLELNIPALRERKEDLGPLVEHFLSTVPLRENSPRQFTEEAIAVLAEYHWPGNIVELRNVISQVCILCDRPVVDAAQLLKHWQLPQRGSRKDLTGLNLEDAETYLILEAVARCDGNKTAAAKQLGITSRTLQNKMQKYRKLGFVK